MVDSVRERILQDLQATVEGITTANGFNYSIAIVRRGDFVPETVNGPFPCAIIPEPAEEYPLPQNEADDVKLTVFMTVAVQIVFTQPGEQKSPRASGLVADLLKAMLVDGRRGELAVATHPLTADSGVEGVVGKFGIVTVSFRVHYRQRRSDPTIAA